MGQHLNLYVAEPAHTKAVRAWCDCRADEYFRVPAPGLEETAHRQIQALMWELQRNNNPRHLQCGSTWCVNIWPRLIWGPQLVTPQLIEQLRRDLEYFMIWNENLPGAGPLWTSHGIFDYLADHLGLIVWGDNDGI